MSENHKTLIQCDFDGTLTPEDVSFLILDAFGNPEWRQALKDYKDGKLTVAGFNRRAFATVKVGEEALTQFVREKARVRPRFRELLDYCRDRGLKLVVVSNGLDFYIRSVLAGCGAGDIEFHAASTRFGGDGIESDYTGPCGEPIEDGFKEAYLRSFREQGYRVIYVGNGFSDIPPARQADYIFAIDDLLAACRRLNLRHTPFRDLGDIVQGLEQIK